MSSEPQRPPQPGWKKYLFRWAARPAVEWALLAAALLPFVLISAFNHPTDDDFQGAVFARHLGFWAGIGEYYQHWTGRYTSSFLYGLAYEVSDLDIWLVALRLAPVLLLGALLGATAFALSGLFPQLGAAVCWRLAGYGLVLYLNGIPLVASALYWLSGSAVYTAGIVLTLVLLGVAVRLSQAGPAARPGWGLLGVVASFLLAGTNELSMLLAVAALLGWVLCRPAGQHGWPGLVLLGAVLGAVVTLSAPGNLARAAAVANTAPLGYRLLTVGSKGAYLTLTHLVGWASQGPLLLATLLLALTVGGQEKAWIRSRHFWWLLAGSGVGLLLLPLPTLWLTNEVPARIWNLIYFAFLLSWFGAAHLALWRWPLPARWRLTNGRRRACGGGWLLLVLLGHGSAVHQAWVDLAFRARDYDQAQHHRYRLLEQAHQRGQRQALVPPLLPQEYQYPATIFLHELELSPRDIANTGMAEYFGLDSVRMQQLPRRVLRHFEQ